MTWAIEEKGYSQRRACGLVGLDPKTYRYRVAASRRRRAARMRLRELAAERRRFGYRRLLHPAAAGGHRAEPQEAVPALSRGAADGAQARRPQAGARAPGRR